MSYMEQARKLRHIIEQSAQSLSDETAVKAVCLHPMWASGVSYAVGNYHINYKSAHGKRQAEKA